MITDGGIPDRAWGRDQSVYIHLKNLHFQQQKPSDVQIPLFFKEGSKNEGDVHPGEKNFEGIFYRMQEKLRDGHLKRNKN